MQSLAIPLLFIVWFSFWGFYNFYLVPRNISTEKAPRKIAFVCLIFSIFAIMVSSFPNYTLFSKLLFAYILLIFCVCFFVNTRLAGRISNALFQMTWLLCLLNVLHDNFLVAGLLFWAGHWPAIFIKHVNSTGKHIILACSFIGGLAISGLLVWINLPFSLALAAGIHTIFYYILRPLDTKYSYGIID